MIFTVNEYRYSWISRSSVKGGRIFDPHPGSFLASNHISNSQKLIHGSGLSLSPVPSLRWLLDHSSSCPPSSSFRSWIPDGAFTCIVVRRLGCRYAYHHYKRLGRPHLRQRSHSSKRSHCLSGLCRQRVATSFWAVNKNVRLRSKVPNLLYNDIATNRGLNSVPTVLPRFLAFGTTRINSYPVLS